MSWNKLIKSKFFLFILIAFLLGFGYYFFREVSRQYEIQKQVGVLQQEIQSLEDSNNQLEDLISYFQTEEFKEKELRKRLNLQKEGEHVVILPQSSSTTDVLNDEENKTKNWVLWWNYFFNS